MHAALHGIRVRFGPLVAVDDVSLEIVPGKVLALVGENGAGKSTLMNALFGLAEPEAGRIEIDGQAREWASPQEAIRAGLGMVHQHFMLQEGMTVLENVVLCGEPVRFLGLVDFAAARRKLHASFTESGIAIDLDALVSTLSVGQKQIVEILKMLYRDASLLILDEPTAVLTPVEKDRLFAILRGFAGAGKAVVIITHKLDEVMEIADHVTVMRASRLVSSLPLVQTSKERIAREIVGGDLAPPLKPARREPGAPVLEVRDLRIAGEGVAVGPLSFTVRAGEIVGIAGVSGNGQSKVVQALAGLCPSSGAIGIAGRRIEGMDARGRRLAGLSYMPEDRQRTGLALGATVAENANAGRDDARAFLKGPFLDRAAMARFARELIERYLIRARGPQTTVSGLSGGNKQKLVVARELSRATPLIIAENPTWGVDIGAIELIHGELLRMRDAGHAVLLVSTELDEVLRLSDRVHVMYSGALSRALAAEEADRNTVGRLMTSHDAGARSAA